MNDEVKPVFPSTFIVPPSSFSSAHDELRGGEHGGPAAVLPAAARPAHAARAGCALLRARAADGDDLSRVGRRLGVRAEVTCGGGGVVPRVRDAARAVSFLCACWFGEKRGDGQAPALDEEQRRRRGSQQTPHCEPRARREAQRDERPRPSAPVPALARRAEAAARPRAPTLAHHALAAVGAEIWSVQKSLLKCEGARVRRTRAKKRRLRTGR